MKKDYPHLSDEELEKIANEDNLSKYDHYSNEELEQIANQKPQQSTEKKGIRGIGHDVYETFAEPLRHPLQSLLSGAQSALEQTYGLGKQAVTFPFEAASGHIPRLTRNVAQGFENFVNTPAHIAGYLERKGLAKKGTSEAGTVHINPLDKPEGEEYGDILAQGLPAYALLGPLGEVGQGKKGVRALQRGGAGAGIGLTQNQNPISAAFLNSAIPEISEQTGKAFKSGKEFINEKVNEPIKQLNEHETLIKNVKKSLEENKGDVNKAKEQAADTFNKELEQSHAREQQSLENIHSILPNLPKSVADEQLTQAVSRSHDVLDARFKERYHRFKISEAGQTKVEKPFDHETAIKFTEGLKDVPDTLKQLIKRVSTTKETRHGVGTETVIPPKNSKVSDYVDLMREARDAAFNAYKKADTDTTLTNEQAKQYRAAGDKYTALQKKAEIKIQESVPEDYPAFELIQKDYKNLMVPFKKTSSGGVLHKAAQEGEVSSNFFDELFKPKNKIIREHLLRKEPVKNAIIQNQLRGNKHPLSGSNLEQQAGKISNLSKTEQDAYHLLSPEQKNALQEHESIAVNRKTIEQLLQKVNSPQFDQILHSLERNRLKKYSPEARNRIETIEKEHAKQAKLEQKLRELLELKDEKLTAVEKRNKQIKFAKIIGSLIGLGKVSKYLK